MKTTHTPGPWKVDQAKDLPLAVIADTPNGDGICEIGLRSAVNRANARLIAAAPDLLEACKRLLWEEERPGKVSRGVTMARAAVNKVVGTHSKVLHGQCKVCGHFGEDCTGGES